MITLDKIQDQIAKLKAEGKNPKTIILCRADADKLPKNIRTLFGLNCFVADNFTETTVSPGIYEKVRIDTNDMSVDNRKDPIIITK